MKEKNLEAWTVVGIALIVLLSLMIASVIIDKKRENQVSTFCIDEMRWQYKGKEYEDFGELVRGIVKGHE